MAPLFGGLYAAAYGVGGQPLVRRLVQNYGPVIALPVLGYGRVVAVADPALAKQVFTAKPDVLLGGEGVGPAAAIYGRRSMFRHHSACGRAFVSALFLACALTVSAPAGATAADASEAGTGAASFSGEDRVFFFLFLCFICCFCMLSLSLSRCCSSLTLSLYRTPPPPSLLFFSVFLFLAGSF